ncbi:D-2-hydroxyacid dehydrogenase [Psychromarinibacter sp. S121]|uniref:D-2-hydroxyacid dehydrogenase n=1 Tax=Psychromarinibacter sp. S121 TaxID=3415127 RepID=UPI003C7C895A
MKIHFECSPKTRPSMQFDAKAVDAVLAKTPGLADGLEFTFNSDPAQSDAYLADADVLVVSNPVDLSGLDHRAPKLRWAQVMSAGVEKVIAHIPDTVQFTNARGAHTARAGEFGITTLLMLNNRIPAFATQQRERVWKQSPQAIVAGKTVTILGLGALGSASAKWAKLFDMRVVGVTRSGRPHEHADEVHGMDGMAAAFEKSDFVLITLPLTPETKGLVSREMLDRLPAHAGVINIGRAEVMDYDALADKLRDGSLSGAVLDVFPKEPLPESSPLWSVPNLFLTPHSGLDDPESFAINCLEIFAENLEAFKAGAPLKTPVDKAAGY